jgi:hypothetical protein
MIRNIVLFAALFFVALVAGAAFAIWIEYNPDGMSSAFYAEKMQHAITALGNIPINNQIKTWNIIRLIHSFA